MVHIMLGTYNGEKYIKEQIDSIIQQTYKEWKLYISDDSQDNGTIQIIKEYLVKFPEKMVLLEKRDRTDGAKGNFSYLFENMGTADYYLFCDQDDVWNTEKLKYLVKIMDNMNNDNPRLLYHNIEVVDEELKSICTSFTEYSGLTLRKNDSLKQLLMYNCIPGCSMIFNNALKELINKIPQENAMHDWWVVLVAECFNSEIIYVKKILGLYRQHRDNEIGAIKKVKLVNYIARCFKVWKLNDYKHNNQIMRREMLTQGEGLLKYYGSDMCKANYETIEEFCRIMKSKNKTQGLYLAYKKGYTFKGFFFTIKFYCI